MLGFRALKPGKFDEFRAFGASFEHTHSKSDVDRV